jgi:hypothetical protein
LLGNITGKMGLRSRSRHLLVFKAISFECL